MPQLTLVIGNKNYSSWSLRPWLAMREAELEFEEIQIPLYTPEAPAQIRQYSPSGKVPALRHGDILVWDSLAIFEYLVEQFPAVYWLPEDSKSRAIARSICAEMHSGFMELRQRMPMNIRARYPGEGMTPAVQADIARITTIWQECRQAYQTQGDFLFGEFTLADAMYAPVVTRFITYGVTLDPICQDYCDAIVAVPAMQEWIAAAHAEPETISMYDLEEHSQS